MHFLKSDIIKKWLQNNFDICFLTETHLCKGEQFKLEDFVEYHNAFSTYKDKKPRGGISCFITPTFLQYIEKIDTTSPEHIAITFKNQDIIFGAYIPPIDSMYFNLDDFNNICNILYNAVGDVSVIGGGDLNARVADINLKTKPGLTYRPNPDKVMNSHGKEVLNICDSFNCFILNNLTVKGKVLDGDFTFYKGEAKSQNDILISNLKGVENVQSFKIHEVPWNPSDHAPISISTCINISEKDVGELASQDILSTAGPVTRSKRQIIDVNTVNWVTYTNIIKNELNVLCDVMENLERDKNLDTMDNMIDVINNCMNNAVSASRKTLVLNNETMNTVTPAFENNQDLVNFIGHSVTKKELSAWSTIISSKSSKDLWEKISWNGSFEPQLTSRLPQLEDLVNHFQEKGKATDDSTLLNLVDTNTYVPVLDDEITVNEVEETVEKLKENKSTGDGWVKPMISKLDDRFFSIIMRLFLMIFSFQLYPTSWRTTLVNAIYKRKGLPKFSKNYRPISLVDLLAKLFDFILAGRFTKWFTPNDAQTAYQKGKSSADHVFFLRCVISYARKVKKKIFLVAIDFDGAFDRVSRSTLIRKLVMFGAGSTFTLCLAYIYMSTNNIMYQGNVFQTYKLYTGIKQGLPLSPLLFLFYIDDIFSFFQGVYGSCVSVLIHADDVTLIAENRDLATGKLRSLMYYCNLNKIIPQYTKCNFIVINGREADKMPLPFGDAFVDNIHSISLLGSFLSQTGRIKDDMKMHMKKRYSSCVKFYNFLRSHKLAPLHVKLKVLKACVINSLLYNCETFGDYYPKDLENLYHNLIKATLQVRKSTPNAFVLIETGLSPLKAIIYGRQLNFFKKFNDILLKDGARAKMMDDMNTNMTSYLKHYHDLSRKYANSTEIHNEYKENLKISIQNQAQTDGKSKFKTYIDINPDLVPSPFLQSNSTLVTDITKFRLGTHFLPVETGRWTRTPREERLCQTCEVFGDEKHFVYDCSLVNRNGIDIPNTLSDVWRHQDIYKLFSKLKETEYL